MIWPDEIMRQRGGRNFWKDWVPEIGMEGQVRSYSFLVVKKLNCGSEGNKFPLCRSLFLSNRQFGRIKIRQLHLKYLISNG